MKRYYSAVWRFFDRIEENGIRTAVCKLCDKRYKHSGSLSTTTFRLHMLKKHPIQWELGQNESSGDDGNQSTTCSMKKTRKRSRRNDSESYATSIDEYPTIQEVRLPILKVNLLESETVNEDGNKAPETISLVNHIQEGSDEEWLNDEVFEKYEVYASPEKKRKLHRKVNREVASSLSVTPNSPKPQIIINNTNKEYLSFGDFVSSKLEKLKNHQSRSNVQQLIATILWQAEYGMYDKMDAVNRILLHSMQDSVPSVQGNISVINDISNIRDENIINPTIDY